jgi:hypothetical protein
MSIYHMITILKGYSPSVRSDCEISECYLVRTKRQRGEVHAKKNRAIKFRARLFFETFAPRGGSNIYHQLLDGRMYFK